MAVNELMKPINKQFKFFYVDLEVHHLELRRGKTQNMLTESCGLVHRIMIYSGQGQDTSNDFTHTEYLCCCKINGRPY